MKVTFLTPNLEVHGGNIVLKKYADFLVSKGNQVTIITSDRPQTLSLDKDIQILTYKHCRIRYLDFFTFQLIYLGRISKLIEETDIVIPIYSPLILPVILAKRKRNLCAKIVVLFQDFFEMIWVGRIIRFMLSLKMVKNEIAGIVSVSRPIAAELSKHCGLESEVIVNGIEHDFFYPVKDKSDYILFVGRPQKPKGFPTFIKAVQILKKKRPGLRVKVVSPGGQEKIENGIEYISYRDRKQLRDLYGRALVYICASNGESFGLPPLESMACGTAVVLTNTVGTREYSEDGVNCYVVPVGDAEEIARKVEILLSDNDLRKSMEKKGVGTALKYTWAKSTKAFSGYIASVTGF